MVYTSTAAALIGFFHSAHVQVSASIVASTIIDFDLRSETCGCVCYGTQHAVVGLTAGSLEEKVTILLLCTLTLL